VRLIPPWRITWICSEASTVTAHYPAAAPSATWSTTQAKAISHSDVALRPHTHRERAAIRGHLVRLGELQNEVEIGQYQKLV
jgi:hypothetical protein